MEEGSIAEESGDRWLGSDIAKALRFYQKAYDAYTKSIELNWSAENADAYYNASRMLLQVYLLHKSSDGLALEDLTNIDEIYGPNSIVQTLNQILDKHLKALEICGRHLDLLYNTATVYVEILESDVTKEDNVPIDQLMLIYKSGEQILSELLPQQVNALETFVRDLASSTTETNAVSSSARSPNMEHQHEPEHEHEQEEFESDEVTQPVDVFETVLLSYRLIQATYENLSESGREVAITNTTVEPFVVSLDKIVNELLLKYSENSISKNEMLQNITPAQVNELKIAKNSIISLQISDAFEVINIWEKFFNNEVLDEIPEKYLSCVDTVQTVLERNDITLNTVNSSTSDWDKEGFWKLISQQNSLLKKAQGLTQDDLNAKKKLPLGVEQGIGSTIIQLCDIMIARADLNLQMSMMKDYEPSMKNQAALLQNGRILLKSSMNIANTSGGLRERAIEKLDREKKLSEAVFRLCLLEGKTSLEELDQIMTRPRWLREYKETKRIDIYNEYLKRIPI